MSLVEHRPWGKYEILYDGEDCKVKKIYVNPNQSYHINITIKDKRCGLWSRAI